MKWSWSSPINCLLEHEKSKREEGELIDGGGHGHGMDKWRSVCVNWLMPEMVSRCHVGKNKEVIYLNTNNQSTIHSDMNKTMKMLRDWQNM